MESYRELVRLYINPAIGHIRLGDLGSEDLERMIGRVQEQGLSPRTQQYTRAVLRAALN